MFTAFSESRADLQRGVRVEERPYAETTWPASDILRRSAGRAAWLRTWPAPATLDLEAAASSPCTWAANLAAAQFHLVGFRTVHAWLIAHEMAFERYSPGLLLFQDILRWMDGQPYARLDFGCGDYRFKREFANARQGVMHGFVAVPSAAGLVRAPPMAWKGVQPRPCRWAASPTCPARRCAGWTPLRRPALIGRRLAAV